MGTPKPPSPPAGTQQAGRRLWRAVLRDFELDEHELTLLRQAIRVADLCDRLQAEVEEGPLLSEGRVHPAVVELRQQQIVLARLVVALQIPMGLTAGEDRTQRRGARGVYKMRAVS